ncbi:Cytochrome P450 [Hibiscus syriacus]|uniref:Cytochrome P450 n=1 Tax=Hibiscus syriacus TaxID=106335 RepID=A0A6A2YU72_HIBSY|nr:Cytochrome P450 [Hibiscus syriacus]
MIGEADIFGSDFMGLLVNACHDSDEKNRLSVQDASFSNPHRLARQSKNRGDGGICTPRKVERQVRVGKLMVPTYLELDIRFLALHHDPDLWGDDVHLFKPERFAQRIAKTTNYNTAAFVPFGFGPRSCVGMSFAMTGIKIVLSMILQRYSFTLSPAFVHSPLPSLVLKPQHGIPLLFRSLRTDA